MSDLDILGPGSTELQGSSGNLKQWLQRVNCHGYYDNFVENGITFDLLPELDTGSLKELGVTKLGDRLRLEIAISSLNTERLTDSITLDTLTSLVTQYIEELNEKRVQNFGIGLETSPLTSLKEASTPTSSFKTVTFILQDGSTKKVNVTGCFNAQSIKRKVLRKLGFRSQDPQYDAYIHIDLLEPAVLLYDVELVTISYSPDRVEKNRIMFVPQGESPSSAALAVSKRILERSLSSGLMNRKLNQYHMADESNSNKRPALRNFFGQRPPSELISSNLAEYFPETKQKDLEKTVRNSVRCSVRLSKKISITPSITSSRNSIASSRRSILSDKRVPSKTIGDVMVNSYNAIEDVSLKSSPEDNEGTYNQFDNSGAKSMISTKSNISRIPIAASFADSTAGDRSSRIELLSIDSDSDEDDLYSEYYADDGGDIDSISEEPRHWLRGARIGAGSFGTVYLGMNPLTGELMAVKQLPILNKNNSADIEKQMQEQQREMVLLKQLNHENIVRYYGSSTNEDTINIFLEYVPGGSVQTMLKSYGPFEEPLIRNFIRQVLIGLSYLHGEDIIHRDIKGANILIDIKGTVKIGDFGISRKVNQIEDEDETERKSARRASLQGSVYWMAPEVVKQTAYTKKADIWSVGCLVVEMFTGKHPFPEFSQMQAIFKIGTHISPQIPEWCTEEAKQFLKKTFEVNYKERPDAIDLLGDPFLTPLIMSKK